MFLPSLSGPVSAAVDLKLSGFLLTDVSGGLSSPDAPTSVGDGSRAPGRGAVSSGPQLWFTSTEIPVPITNKSTCFRTTYFFFFLKKTRFYYLLINTCRMCHNGDVGCERHVGSYGERAKQHLIIFRIRYRIHGDCLLNPWCPGLTQRGRWNIFPTVISSTLINWVF